MVAVVGGLPGKIVSAAHELCARGEVFSEHAASLCVASVANDPKQAPAASAGGDTSGVLAVALLQRAKVPASRATSLAVLLGGSEDAPGSVLLLLSDLRIGEVAQSVAEARQLSRARAAAQRQASKRSRLNSL